MKAAKKTNSHGSNRNYYIAIACIVAIVLLVMLVNSQDINTVSSYTGSQADTSGQAYAATTVEDIMAQQAKAGQMQKVYTTTKATAYAYLRNK